MSQSSDRIVPNASALYNKHISKELLQRLNKDSSMTVKDDGFSIKKPPIFEKKVKDAPSTVRRPQNLDVRGEISTSSKIRSVIGPKNETDKRNVSIFLILYKQLFFSLCLF